MAFETFFLFGSILLLAAVVWSMKERDFERMSTTWPAAVLTVVCGLLFAFHVSRLFQNMGTWSEGQLLISADRGSGSGPPILSHRGQRATPRRRPLGRGGPTGVQVP